MKSLRIEEIRTAVGGRWLKLGREISVSSVTTDSRDAKPGSMFIAIRGEKFDGHNFLENAADAGCCSAIVRMDAEPPPQISSRFAGGLIGVPDTTAALGRLGAYYRSLIPATVIAVTGSNGKTTVKRMIDHILRRRLKGTASPKSFNNEIGVPLTLLGADGNDDYVICEVGSNAPGEVATLSRLVKPKIAVITSVGPTHLEKLGDIRHVAVEKASLLVSMDADGLAVIWADSEHLAKALRAYNCRMITFGESDSAALRITGYKPDGAAQRFQLNGRAWFKLPVPGRHNAVNALAAIAVAQRFGFEQAVAAEALADFDGVRMRLEREECGVVTIINDAYNANPASVLAAADVLADQQASRRVMIAGDMRELGSQSEQLHVSTGADIARRNIDLLIGVGPLGRYIAKGAEEAGAQTAAFESVQAAAGQVPDLLRKGDVVLIKGSRAMEMEQLLAPIRAAFERKTAKKKVKKNKDSKR